MARLKISPTEFHGEWNYAFTPRTLGSGPKRQVQRLSPSVLPRQVNVNHRAAPIKFPILLLRSRRRVDSVIFLRALRLGVGLSSATLVPGMSL
jgi:hypothetical protein